MSRPEQEVRRVPETTGSRGLPQRGASAAETKGSWSARPRPTDRTGDLVRVGLDQLRLGSLPAPASNADVDLLRAAVEQHVQLPAVLVHRQTMTVIEGADRVVAARSLGYSTIAVTFFEGTEEEAYVEEVRRNAARGRPVSLHERERAAGRILRCHPDWSDRLIAEICRLSPKTVARARQTVAGATDSPSGRIGRDGRRRPTDPRTVRTRIAELLEQRPGASLREIARSLGTSPTTVRDVRRRLQWGENPVPPSLRLRPDEPGGAGFNPWFDAHAITDGDWEPFVGVVPPARLTSVVAEARRRAVTWSRFAQALERRQKP